MFPSARSSSPSQRRDSSPRKYPAS
jgi:hypothetical protein